MRILLHSHVFWPSVGGIESVSHSLALGLATRGHATTVVTETHSANEREVPYRVVRAPSLPVLAKIARTHDIIHSNGASLRLVGIAAALRKPFVWTHGGYQLECIDGAGWIAGHAAPLSPFASVAHHARLFGVRKASVDALKLAIRRLALPLVDANVAISRHLAERQPLPRQSVIYNPVDVDRFSAIPVDLVDDGPAPLPSTFAFLGRLISEKGVEDLLHAFASLRDAHRAGTAFELPTLTIIGDGMERPALETLASRLGIVDRVRFVGSQSGKALLRLVHAAEIFVLPSAWEEPMGITGVELLAARKPLIVSERGGLHECVAGGALAFPNGDRHALAAVMQRLWLDRALRSELLCSAVEIVERFRKKSPVESYLELYTNLLQKRGRSPSRSKRAPIRT
jgi:glycosyltransferase involved in cell wall biosynthesis